MKKIERIMYIIILLLEFITCYEVAKFTSPFTFISILIMMIVINAILVDIDK